MSREVSKAVFPVAGLGSRFLPATKASPKEMLPIVDKPIIQFAVEEAIDAGITEMVFVTGRTKRAIEDHFDRSVEMELELEQRGKTQLLEELRAILPPHVNCIYIRQAKPLGLGHAVLCARPAIGDHPFAVILPDDLIRNNGRGCVGQMVDAYQNVGGSLLAVQQVERELTDQYGIVSAESPNQRLSRIHGIVEKPAPADAPSTLGVVGRYLLTPEIFDYLETQSRGAGDEIQLTDAIGRMLDSQAVYAYQFEGKRFDCGSKIGFLEATLDVALSRDDLGPELRKILAGLNPR